MARQPSAAAAPFEVARGHTGTVPLGGQASVAAAPSGDLGVKTSKPIWETVGHTVPRVDRPEWKELLAALSSIEERERDGAMDARILRGCEVSEANLQRAKRAVRFLASSTFTVGRPCVYRCALWVGLRCPPPALTEAHSLHACAQGRPVCGFLPPAARMRISRLTPCTASRRTPTRRGTCS